MNETLTDFLPYDYARCIGTTSLTCADCMRKLSPSRPEGWQTFLHGNVMESDGSCSSKISVKQWKERK